MLASSNSSAESVAPSGSRPAVIRQVWRALINPNLLWSLINAQLRLRRATHVAHTVRLTGRVRLSGAGTIIFHDRIRIDGTTVRSEFTAHAGARLEVGAGTYVNYGCSISAHELVSIGRDCLIGQYAIINDNDYHALDDRTQIPPAAPVILEDRVWLGARVIVLKGVRIGHDAVVAAGSVVTHDVPPRSVAAGVPARVIRQI
jgi:maltose O-acetyltransferase